MILVPHRRLHPSRFGQNGLWCVLFCLGGVAGEPRLSICLELQKIDKQSTLSYYQWVLARGWNTNKFEVNQNLASSGPMDDAHVCTSLCGRCMSAHPCPAVSWAQVCIWHQQISVHSAIYEHVAEHAHHSLWTSSSTEQNNTASNLKTMRRPHADIVCTRKRHRRVTRLLGALQQIPCWYCLHLVWRLFDLLTAASPVNA